jgi:hypothetical protein
MVTTDARSPGRHAALRNMRCCGVPRRTGAARRKGLPAGNPGTTAFVTPMFSFTEWTRGDFLFEGIEAGNGLGDDVGADAVARLWEAFQEPFDFDWVHAASLYDDAGFCASCRVAYCRTRWSARRGAEWCPQGHFKSMDPHWEPDDH